MFQFHCVGFQTATRTLVRHQNGHHGCHWQNHVQYKLIQKRDRQTAGPCHKHRQKIQIHKVQRKSEFNETRRPRHIVKHARHGTQNLNKRQDDFQLPKIPISFFRIFHTFLREQKDTQNNDEQHQSKNTQKDKGICDTGTTGAFRACRALFDVSVCAYQAQGTTVPVQTLFVGVGKHGPVLVRRGVVVAFARWATTFQGQCGSLRAGVALMAIAEDGRVGGWAPGDGGGGEHFVSQWCTLFKMKEEKTATVHKRN